MKRIMLRAAAIMAAVAIFAAPVLADGYKRITGKEMAAILKDGTKTVIVDVREPELFEKGHIPGAINIPYDDAHKRILKELSPKDRIVFVCHGGPMGDELADILAKNGYKSVYNLEGGMKKWNGPLSVK